MFYILWFQQFFLFSFTPSQCFHFFFFPHHSILSNLVLSIISQVSWFSSLTMLTIIVHQVVYRTIWLGSCLIPLQFYHAFYIINKIFQWNSHFSIVILSFCHKTIIFHSFIWFRVLFRYSLLKYKFSSAQFDLKKMVIRMWGLLRNNQISISIH